MTGKIRCECCGTLIPVTQADLGREVVCPVSRRLVAVPATGLDFAPPPAPRVRRRRWLVAVLALALVALFCGLGGFALREFGADRPIAGEANVDAKVVEVAAGGSQTVTLDVNRGAGAATPIPGAPGTGPDVTPGRDPKTTAPTPTGVAPTAVLPIHKPDSAPAGETSNPKATPEGPPATPAAPAEPKGPPASPEVSSTKPKGNRPATSRRLVARLDRRTTAELEAELLKVREVGLDTAKAPNTSAELARAATAMIRNGLAYPGPILLSKSRPDLAELPLQVGPRTALDYSAAKGLTDLARKFRAGLAACTPSGDVRPDPSKVEAMLLGDGLEPTAWTVAAAVPCLRQMLPGEVTSVRNAACEAYRRTRGPAALDALVAVAVFDTDFDNRAAAVDALGERDSAEVAARLAAALDYPWTPAVEHAAEALVALKLTEAAPALVAELRRASAEALTVPVGGATHAVRREMVRTNHARNCVLCHAPSLAAADLVRGAVPDPARPLGGPTAYYDNSSTFVRADTTYLRQDFSAMQPVANPGPWPAHQRFDYLVALRPAGASEAPPDDAGRSAALLFALRGLTGADRGRAAADWAEAGAPAAEARGFVGETARLVSLRQTPDPTILLHYAEFGKPLLALGEDALTVVLARMRRGYGEAGRYALIAYLRPLLKTGTEAEQATAALLMARLLDAASWSRPLTAAERGSAGKLLTAGNTQLRGLAGALLIDDPDGPRDSPKEFLALLTGADAELRRAAIEALARQTTLSEEFYIALARAARDEVQGVREAAATALFTLKRVPREAGQELATSYLARRTWDTAAARQKSGKMLFELLTALAPGGETWFAELAAAATAERPSDAPAAEVARLLGLHRKVPVKSLPDLVALLAHPTYGPVAVEILTRTPRLAHEPLLEGLKAAKPADRAAAAKVLGTTASLSRTDATIREQWRAADEALAAMAVNDPDQDVRFAANSARKALVKGQP